MKQPVLMVTMGILILLLAKLVMRDELRDLMGNGILDIRASMGYSFMQVSVFIIVGPLHMQMDRNVFPEIQSVVPVQQEIIIVVLDEMLVIIYKLTHELISEILATMLAQKHPTAFLVTATE